MTANYFAIAVILAWPLVAIYFYRTRSLTRATLYTILGALLLLPTNVFFKIEMIPAFDKNSVPNIAALVACLFLGSRARTSRVRFGLTEILIFIFVASPLVTSALNNDTIVVGERIIPGVGSYDAISALLSQALIFLPFYLGRHYINRASDIEEILRVLVAAGLFYSIPMLFEIRMSPQLSSWIYGYFPSSFNVEARYGGYRPVVFMKNGLSVAFFSMTSLLAAIALWRVRHKYFGAISGYLGLLLVLCKSAGALVYGVLIGFVVRYSAPKGQARFAIILVCLALLYPMLRLVDFFPTRTLFEVASTLNQERADSLKFRFDQEDQLLSHASQRFLFGWGRYGRNRVFDSETGKDNSVTDGLWIQSLGQFGIIGFIAQFGLLTIPIFRASTVLKYVELARDRLYLTTLMLICSLSVIEQIPNSSVSPWTWLLAGALLGRAESIRGKLRLIASMSGNLISKSGRSIRASS